jgi:hypothetical protein
MEIEEGFEIGFTEDELVALNCLEDVVRAVAIKEGTVVQVQVPADGELGGKRRSVKERYVG